MFYPDSFRVSTPSDHEIQITRDFHAPRQLVFDAFTKPDLVKRWLLGPPGWTMPVCQIDLKIDGVYRYVWSKPGDKDMGIGGVFREIVAPARIVATEKFDKAWYPGEALNTTAFVDQGDITNVKITILYESTEARDTARRSGMEHGVAASYKQLEKLLALPAETGLLIEAPQITERVALLAAAVHLKIARSEMRSAIGPGIAEVMAAANNQGIGPAGPWFTHHLQMQPETFDFEICVPVTAPFAPMGRVKPLVFPAIRVAHTIYGGGYENLGEAWGQFRMWLSQSGRVAGPDLFECYAVGPESSPDPANWRTELIQPLID